MRKKHLYRHKCPGCGEQVDWALAYCYSCGPSAADNPGWVDFEMDPKLRDKMEKRRLRRRLEAQEGDTP